MNNYYSEIRTLISKGKIKEALTTLEKNESDEGGGVSETVLSIKGRYYQLKSKHYKGVISEEYFTLETNKIINSILTYISSKITTNKTIKKKKTSYYFIYMMIVFSSHIALSTKSPFATSITDEILQVTPIKFNIAETTDSLSLLIKINSKKIEHKLAVPKKMSVYDFKQAIIHHYRIRDILYQLGNEYNAIYLMVNNKKLNDELKTLYQSKIKDGDVISIIPVFEYHSIGPLY